MVVIEKDSNADSEPNVAYAKPRKGVTGYEKTTIYAVPSCVNAIAPPYVLSVVTERCANHVLVSVTRVIAFLLSLTSSAPSVSAQNSRLSYSFSD